MSLINKMLQDLESRQDAPGRGGRQKTVYEDLKPARTSGFRAPPRRLMLTLAAVVIVGAGAYAGAPWGGRLFSGDGPAVKPQPVPAAPAPAAAPETAAVAAAPPAAKETPALPAATPVAEKANEAAAPAKPERNEPVVNAQAEKEEKKGKATVAAAKKPGAGGAGPKMAAPAAPASEESRADAGVVDKKVRSLSAEEQAESEYRRAVNLLQQGRAGDAEQRLRSALKADAAHVKARELLAGLALQNGRWREARQILEQGMAKAPERYSLAPLLARVYVEHGADQKALSVMEASRPAAAGNADYLAFLAALYQRAGKHPEAVKAYTEAVTLNPQEGRWWLGMGISLEAGRDWNAAASAYEHAIGSGALDDKLLQYAQQRLAIVKNK